jgi:hypothetical protein
MTEGQLGLLIIVAAIGLIFSKKKKKDTAAEFFFIDVVEVRETPKKRRSPALVNMAIVGGIILFIWMMNH